MASALAIRSEAAISSTPVQRPDWTGLAVHQGGKWVSVCRELGIASQADTPTDAMIRLRTAVSEALAVAEEAAVAAGEPMGDDEVVDFLRSHQGPLPIYVERLAL